MAWEKVSVDRKGFGARRVNYTARVSIQKGGSTKDKSRVSVVLCEDLLDKAGWKVGERCEVLVDERKNRIGFKRSNSNDSRAITDTNAKSSNTRHGAISFPLDHVTAAKLLGREKWIELNNGDAEILEKDDMIVLSL